MTEAEARRVASAHPTVDVRYLVHVVDGAAAEAAAGLTATRVVCGWRIVVDREPPGAWLITANLMTAPAYPCTPPDEVLVAFMCIAMEAGVAQQTIIDDMTTDVAVGELRLAWTTPALEPA